MGGRPADQAGDVGLAGAPGDRVDGLDDDLGDAEGAEPGEVVAAGRVGVVAGVLDDVVECAGDLGVRTVGAQGLGDRPQVCEVVVPALLVDLPLVRVQCEQVRVGNGEPHDPRPGAAGAARRRAR